MSNSFYILTTHSFLFVSTTRWTATFDSTGGTRDLVSRDWRTTQTTWWSISSVWMLPCWRKFGNQVKIEYLSRYLEYAGVVTHKSFARYLFPQRSWLLSPLHYKTKQTFENFGEWWHHLLYQVKYVYIFCFGAFNQEICFFGTVNICFLLTWMHKT